MNLSLDVSEMVIVGSQLEYGGVRTYIGIGMRNKQVGKIRKVSYVDICDMSRKVVQMHGSMRLRELVQRLSEHMKVNLSAVQVKKGLGRNVVEKQFYNDEGVLVVEDWVVV